MLQKYSISTLAHGHSDPSAHDWEFSPLFTATAITPATTQNTPSPQPLTVKEEIQQEDPSTIQEEEDSTSHI